MESPQSLESSHDNEGSIERHHIGKTITCFLPLHDDFADFSSISLVPLNSWPNHKIEKIQH